MFSVRCRIKALSALPVAALAFGVFADSEADSERSGDAKGMEEVVVFGQFLPRMR